MVTKKVLNKICTNPLPVSHGSWQKKLPETKYSHDSKMSEYHTTYSYLAFPRWLKTGWFLPKQANKEKTSQQASKQQQNNGYVVIETTKSSSYSSSTQQRPVTTTTTMENLVCCARSPNHHHTLLPPHQDLSPPPPQSRTLHWLFVSMVKQYTRKLWCRVSILLLT